MSEQGYSNGSGALGWPRARRLFAYIVASFSILFLVILIPITWQNVTAFRDGAPRAMHSEATELELLFQNTQMAMKRAASDGLQDARRSSQDNVILLRQSYNALLDKIVLLDQMERTDEQGAAIFNDTAFAELKLRTVSLLPAIRGNDESLQDALPELTGSLGALGDVLQSFTREMRRDADILAQDKWTQVKTGLRNISIIGAALIATMLLLVLDFRKLYLINWQNVQRNRTASARLETVINTSQDAIIVTDGSQLITEFNRAAERMFGMANSVARNLPIRELIYNADGSNLFEGKLAAAQGDKVQMLGRDAVGREFPIEVSVGIAMRDGKHIQVCFLSDISDRLEIERDLRTSRDRALAGERARTHFLAVMSHEMRTPLTGILGVVELMQAEQVSDRKDQYLEVLQASGQILLSQINDVLDLTEIESMGINLTDQPFDFDALLKEIMTTLRPSASRQNSQLQLETLPQQLGWFRGDPIRLRQIMINLIGNAIKFTRDGQILIEVTVGPDTQGLILGRHRIEIQVSDTGTGIPRDQLEQIFEDFVRAEQTSARKIEGTGLGLGIVKRLVDVMGGKLGADSVEGEGSMFWVSLSLQQVEKPSAIAPPTGAADDVRPTAVLLVEDNATNRFILREMLSRDGHDVSEAADGAQAVKMADARSYDLVLMDINMPVMNGLQATEAIRRGGGASANARIVALTAHVFDHEHLRYEDAGIDDIVLKPLKWDGLRRILQGEPAILVTHPREGVTMEKGAEPLLLDRAVLNILLETLGPVKLGRLLTQFMSEGQASIKNIKQGQNDPRQILRDRIHGLAGQAATFGARRLHFCLGGLEDKILDMSDEEIRGIPRVVETVWHASRIEFDRFRRELPLPPETSDILPKGGLRDSNDPRRMI
jgi:PAS domain S-box-containing protein